MKIVVAKEDIYAGEQCSTDACPIALAIKRAYQGAYVSVSYRSIIVDEKSYALPGIAGDFIDKFDDDKPVQPISFELVGLEETP